VREAAQMRQDAVGIWRAMAVVDGGRSEDEEEEMDSRSEDEDDEEVSWSSCFEAPGTSSWLDSSSCSNFFSSAIFSCARRRKGSQHLFMCSTRYCGIRLEQSRRQTPHFCSWARIGWLRFLARRGGRWGGFGASLGDEGAVGTSYSSIWCDGSEVVESYGSMIQVFFTLDIQVSRLDEALGGCTDSLSFGVIWSRFRDCSSASVGRVRLCSC
jgi:hypothetical protein